MGFRYKGDGCNFIRGSGLWSENIPLPHVSRSLFHFGDNGTIAELKKKHNG
jgi:hypothetical protein